MLLKKKPRKTFDENENEEQLINVGESDLRKNKHKEPKDEFVSEKSDSDISSSNLSLNQQEHIEIFNSEEIKNLKENLLNNGKDLKKSKSNINIDSASHQMNKINLEPVLDNANFGKNLNYKKFKSEEERINVYDSLNRNEEDFFVKYIKDKIKNDQPFRILFEISQKCKYNIPEVIINPIGKNDQFSVKIFISDFYFYGDGLAQSKKEGKSNYYFYP